MATVEEIEMSVFRESNDHLPDHSNQDNDHHEHSHRGLSSFFHRLLHLIKPHNHGDPQHSHDHSGVAGLAICADDLPHAIGLVQQYATQAAKGGLNFGQQASEIAKAPFSYLQNLGTPGDPASLGTSIAFDVPIGFFGVYTVFFGHGQVKAASNRKASLNVWRKEVSQRIAQIKTLLEEHREELPRQMLALVEAQRQIEQKTLEYIDFTIKQCERTVHIGKSAATSGGMVASRTLIEATATSAAYAGAPSAGLAGALAGTVLGPIASGAATAVGISYSTKAVAERDRYRELVARFNQSCDAKHRDARYRAFIADELKAHEFHHTHFPRALIAFSTATGLSTASGIANMLMIAAGAGAFLVPGAAVVSIPAGLVAVNSVAGFGGAIAAGALTPAFLFGHPKSERYESHAYQCITDPKIDANFMAKADLLQKGAGAKLRAQNFNKISEQNKRRHDFLQDVAAQQSKRYVPSEDNKKLECEAPESFIRGNWTKLRAWLNDWTPRLAVKDVEHFLGNGATLRDQCAFMSEFLSFERALLDAKEQFRRDTHGDAEISREADWAEAVRNLLGHNDHDRQRSERIEELSRTLTNLQEQLRPSNQQGDRSPSPTMRNLNGQSMLELSKTKRDFLNLRSGNSDDCPNRPITPTEIAKIDQQFAEYLLVTAEKDYRNARGQAFASALWAAGVTDEQRVADAPELPPIPIGISRFDPSEIWIELPTLDHKRVDADRSTNPGNPRPAEVRAAELRRSPSAGQQNRSLSIS
jgi:hypothetical protein